LWLKTVLALGINGPDLYKNFYQETSSKITNVIDTYFLGFGSKPVASIL